MGKKIYFDTHRCVGCGACAVACMDQNDIFPEKGDPALRRLYQVESQSSPPTPIRYLSVACKHCTASPCVKNCPTGALTQERHSGAVVTQPALCIGCRSCAEACPFAIPRYDLEGKLRKCHLCAERVDAGLLPACVRVCPTQALRFDAVNRLMGEKEDRFVRDFSVAPR